MWLTPVLKMGIDQTAWSLFWNTTYYVLLGAMKLESPATIAQTVRNTWWDLLKAGWRLWPFVHIGGWRRGAAGRGGAGRAAGRPQGERGGWPRVSAG